MAIKKTIEIDVETKDATKGVDALVDKVDELVDVLKKGQTQADKTTKEVKDIGKAGKIARKGVKALSSGFKALGGAIKATGIGLLITAFVTLKEILGQNQKVVDFVSTAFNTASIVFNKVFDIVVDTFDAVSKATGGFDALGKVMSGLLTLAIEPLKIGFNVLRLNLLNAQLAWENSFFGDKDPKTVKSLNESIKEVTKSIAESAVKTKNAGKDIIENFGEAVSEVGQLGSALVEETSKVSISASIEQAKTITNLANASKIAEAEQKKLIEQYDRQAEKLRQIRDNELLSIDERQKANNELGVVLENQEKALLKQADLVLASANAELLKSNSIENQTALIDAQANRLGVLAQIEGFRSEQDVNKNALIKEQNELVQSGTEADTIRALNQKKFNTELEEDALKRLEQQRLDLEAEKEIEAERLQLKIDSFALGTQARLDAENELKDKLQEIDQQITINEDAQNKKRVENDKVSADAKAKIQSSVLDVAQQGINVLKQVFEKNKEIQAGLVVAENAAGIAKILTNTAVANAAATAASPLTGGQPFVALNTISAGLGIASTVAATAKALSSLGKSGGGGGASAPSGGGGGSAPPPAFNLVGNGNGVDQIQDDLGGEQPLKAFVVGSEVTNQQEIDNAQAESASLG